MVEFRVKLRDFALPKNAASYKEAILNESIPYSPR